MKALHRMRRLILATGADLQLGGRRFVVTIESKGLDVVHRRLGDRFGLVVTSGRDQPLVVLRLGDFLRTCRFRDPVKTSACASDRGE
jgi:hypothetical protein